MDGDVGDGWITHEANSRLNVRGLAVVSEVDEVDRDGQQITPPITKRAAAAK